MTAGLACVLLVVQIAFVVAAPIVTTAFCDQTGNATPKCVLKPGEDPTGIATGSFADDLSVTGWGKLKIKTYSNLQPELLKMYAAGYIEGALTAERIAQQIQNMYDILFDKERLNPKILEWLDEQEGWTRSRITNYNSLSDFWKQVALIMAQFDGMMAGFQSVNTQQIDVPVHFAFQMLSGWGDLLDLIPALIIEKRPKWESMSGMEISRQLGIRGHCSALVKVLGDFSDIFMGQSAWFSYGAMNRIYKHYQFDSSPGAAAKKVSFSSYPGCLVSIDDFYMMDSGLVMLQTTNSIINQSLYDAVTPFALLAWQRVRVANSMSSNGKTWSDIISTFNSGTYNNQYMVIDLKKFRPGLGLDDGALWVSEQIPGLVKSADETEILRYGYWPSYNVPFFPDIWLISGYNILGKNNSHSAVPRAQIFRRDQATVVDMPTMKQIMRYNNYKVDPYSHGQPGNAICSRFDLDMAHPSAGGCYDSKITSYSTALKLICEAVNGPTTQNEIPPFSWIREWDNVTHAGMPFTFNFDFELMDPKW